MTDKPSNPDQRTQDELRELKRQLRPKYLGKFGIHAIGTRASEDAICVYLNAGASEQATELNNLKDMVAPHRLVIIKEESPRIASDS